MGRNTRDTENAKTPEEFLPLTPAVLNILLALADDELHGYAIMREVSERTGGGMRLGPTTLYRSIKQMLQKGWVEESGERPVPDLDDERRRYYRLTDFGRRVTVAEVRRLEMLVDAAQRKGLAPGLDTAPGGA